MSEQPVTDLVFAAERNGKAPPAVEETHRSHLRLAERLADRHRDRLRYAHGLGWLVWDGTRWARDRDGEAMRAAVAVVKEAVREAEATADSDLGKDVRKAETANGLTGIVRLASYLRPLAVAADELDADPWAFNTASGTLDLRTGEVRAHDPADLITKVAGCGLDADADGPVFHKFLTEVLPDADVRGFVQRLIGYALLGKVTEHILAIFTGDGQNGKTTLLEAVLKAFGGYAISAEPELLVAQPKSSHPTGQADLLGVRLAATVETDEGRRLAASTVKRLTGGDTIRARRMRQDFFEFTPSHTTVMVTNHKPAVSADDAALWRRLRVVPFDVHVDEPDTRLPERLALELPAILRWAVEGWQDYRRHGLDAPHAVTERTESYRRESDRLGAFLEDRTRCLDTASVAARQLYTAWADWCQEVGEQPGSERSFADAMSARGFDKVKRVGRQTYLGIALTTDSDTPL